MGKFGDGVFDPENYRLIYDHQNHDIAVYSNESFGIGYNAGFDICISLFELGNLLRWLKSAKSLKYNKDTKRLRVTIETMTHRIESLEFQTAGCILPPIFENQLNGAQCDLLGHMLKTLCKGYGRELNAIFNRVDEDTRNEKVKELHNLKDQLWEFRRKYGGDWNHYREQSFYNMITAINETIKKE